jgi:hypothetical protein
LPGAKIRADRAKRQTGFDVGKKGARRHVQAQEIP